MTNLTARQNAAASLLPRSASLIVPHTCGNSDVFFTAYDSAGQPMVGATIGADMSQAMFGALCRKGALVQINDTDRPHVCLGYTVAR